MQNFPILKTGGKKGNCTFAFFLWLPLFWARRVIVGDLVQHQPHRMQLY